MDGLIQVLDRKKFCLARESKSGLGLTPLHTSALYEQLDVFEYLATKFPETLKLIDFHGRTPMDYVTSMTDKTFLDKLLNTESVYEVCSFFSFYFKKSVVCHFMSIHTPAKIPILILPSPPQKK